MTETTLDKICSAIDLITEKKIQGLEFDRTISATIINADNSKDGEYTVSDGSSSFLAYSENTNYKVDEQVYVTVPNNNFNEQKWITGRRADDNNKEITYIPPFDQYFDLTGNLFEGNEYALNGDGLLANNPTPNNLKNDIRVSRDGHYTIYRPIGDTIEINEGIAYERLGIKADFKSLIPTAISGNYGLEVRFFAIRPMTADSNRYEQLSYSVRLDSKDMWGNPYNFANYFEQQLIYDISEIGMINQMRLYFYQEGNFINNEKEPLEYTIPGTDELLPDNLFIKNIYVSLGNSIEKEEKVVLYTTNSLTYKNSYDNATQNTKKLKIRWAHLFEETTCVAITKAADIEKYIDTSATGVNIRWYQYDKNSNDDLAGSYWKQIKIGQDFTYTFLPNFDNEFESFKVIIELIDKNGLDTYNKNVEVLREEKRVQLNNLRAEMTKILDQIDYYKKINKYNDSVTGMYDQNITDLQNEYNKKLEEAKRVQKQIDKIVLDTSGFYTYLKSDIIMFRNDADNLKPVEEDNIKGLTLKCDDDGVFRLYSALTNDLVTNADQYKDRTITLNFESVLTQEKNAGISEVRWYIPKNNTMVQKLISGIHYFNAEGEFFYENNEEYPDHYKIVRVNPTIDNVEGDTFTHRICKTTQTFRIKSHLMQSLTNNTIYCVIVKDKKVYPAAKIDLVFGTVGTSGTNNTLIIDLEQEVETNSGELEIKPPAWTIDETKKLLFSVHLYDEQDNEIIDNIKSYKWELMYKNVPFAISGNNNTANLTATTDNIYSGCIIKCTVVVKNQISEDDGTATQYVAYYPLGVRSSKSVKNFIGADRIIYDNGGSHPTFYKSPYSVNDSNTIITDDIKLYYNISGNSFEVNVSPVKQYLPQINNSILRPKSLYMNDVDYNLHVHISNKWIQPILVLCNTYGSILLNEWDGSFQMDTEEGTILSTMLGAGRKNEANQFEGVLMGDVRKGAGDYAVDKVGLYGYQDGVQSFGFKVDGTAFIGKSSGTRLDFDGNTGTIQNAGYILGKGIMIDFNGNTTRQGCFIDMQNQIPVYSIAEITTSNTDTYFYRPGVVYYKDNECKTIAGAEVNSTTLPYLTGAFSYGYIPNENNDYDPSRTYYWQLTDENNHIYYSKVKEILQERDWTEDLYVKHTALIDKYYDGLVYYTDEKLTTLAKGKLTQEDYESGVANGEIYYTYEVAIATSYQSGQNYYESDGVTPAKGVITASNYDNYTGNLYRIKGIIATGAFDQNAMYFGDEQCSKVISYVSTTVVAEAEYFTTGVTYYADMNKTTIATGRITHETYEMGKYYTKDQLDNYIISNIDKSEYTSTENYNNAVDNETFYTKLEDNTYIEARGPITHTNFKEEKPLYQETTIYNKLDETNYSYGTYYLWGTEISTKYEAGITYYSAEPQPPQFTQVSNEDIYDHQQDYYNSNKEKVTINETLFNNNKTNYYYYKDVNKNIIAYDRVTPENFNDDIRYTEGKYLASAIFEYGKNYFIKIDELTDKPTYKPALSNITSYNFEANKFYTKYGKKLTSYQAGEHYYTAITCLDSTEKFSNFADANKNSYYYLVSKIVEDGDTYSNYLEYYVDASKNEKAKLRITSQETFDIVLAQLTKIYTFVGKSANGTTYSVDRTYYSDIYCIDVPTDSNGNTIAVDTTNYQNYYYTEVSEDKKSQVLISTTSPYFKVKDRNGYDLIRVDKNESRLAGWVIDRDCLYGKPVQDPPDGRDRGIFALFSQDPMWADPIWDDRRGIDWYSGGSDISDNWRLKIGNKIGMTWDGRSFLPYIYCAKIDCTYSYEDHKGEKQGPGIVTENLEVFSWNNIEASHEEEGHRKLGDYIKWMADQSFKKGMVEGVQKASISLSKDGTVTVSNKYTTRTKDFPDKSWDAGYDYGYRLGHSKGWNEAKAQIGVTPGGCFEKGTLITLADLTKKAIELIIPGDSVISYNELTDKFEISEVTDTIVWHNTINMVKLYFEDGNILIMTACHPILTTDGWKSLDHEMALKEHRIYTDDIKIGQIVITNNGNIKITNIEYLEDIPDHDTYNITVPKNNTYLANGCVVHNASAKNS